MSILFDAGQSIVTLPHTVMYVFGLFASSGRLNLWPIWPAGYARLAPVPVIDRGYLWLRIAGLLAAGVLEIAAACIVFSQVFVSSLGPVTTN